jgi:hypothetical protein
MILQEGGPVLIRLFANLLHMFLNSAFAHADAEFQQFALNLFSTPEPVVLSHLLDKVNSCFRNAWFSLLGFGDMFPISAKELSMPAQQCSRLHQKYRFIPKLS